MSTVLQSEVRLHEGILASLTLQAAWDDHVHQRVEIALLLESAIANLKSAVSADQVSGLLPNRLLNLLFNLEELINGLKKSFVTLHTYKQTLQEAGTEYNTFLDRHTDALAEGIDWMEDLAETWSLSLDEARMSEIESCVADVPRPISEIRDWKVVIDELAHDAEVHD